MAVVMFRRNFIFPHLLRLSGMRLESSEQMDVLPSCGILANSIPKTSEGSTE